MVLGQAECGGQYFRGLLPAEVATSGVRAGARGGLAPWLPPPWSRSSWDLEALAFATAGEYALGEERYMALLKEKGVARIRRAGEFRRSGARSAWAEIDEQMRRSGAQGRSFG